MRLVSYLALDDAGTAVLVDRRLIPVMDGYLTGPDFEPASLADLRQRAETLTGAIGIALDDVETIAPVPVPGKVVCVGLNYREHANEGGRPPPNRPLLFSKFANAVIADGDPIVRPEGTPRPRSRGRARGRHRDVGATRHAGRRARPRRRLRGGQ